MEIQLIFKPRRSAASHLDVSYPQSPLDNHVQTASHPHPGQSPKANSLENLFNSCVSYQELSFDPT